MDNKGPDFALIQAVLRPITDLLENASNDMKVEVATALSGMLAALQIDMGISREKAGEAAMFAHHGLSILGLTLNDLRQSLRSPLWADEKHTEQVLRSRGLL